MAIPKSLLHNGDVGAVRPNLRVLLNWVARSGSVQCYDLFWACFLSLCVRVFKGGLVCAGLQLPNNSVLEYLDRGSYPEAQSNRPSSYQKALPNSYIGSVRSYLILAAAACGVLLQRVRLHCIALFATALAWACG